MKKSVLILIGLIISMSCFSQARTYFSLSDTAFEVGSVYTACDIQYDLDGHGTILAQSKPCLDSIADFMLKHPEMIFEIGSYTDQRGPDSVNLRISQSRATMVKNYLIEKKVDASRLAAAGYGEMNPLNDQKSINLQTDKNKKEELYQENRRTEFKILYIYPSYFSLQDSSFVEGAILRLPIRFDLNKTTLRPESLAVVDSIATFLLAHPQLSVEVRNHADTRSSNKYSTCLTCNRARAVRERLIQQGVAPDRITYAGYDQQLPLVAVDVKRCPEKNAQEELHAINRRTEIRITKVNQ